MYMYMYALECLECSIFKLVASFQHESNYIHVHIHYWVNVLKKGGGGRGRRGRGEEGEGVGGPIVHILALDLGKPWIIKQQVMTV